MIDPRIRTLARKLVEYSCSLKENENVLIECTGSSALPLVTSLVKETYRIGAHPFVSLSEPVITREVVKQCSLEQLKFMTEYDLLKMKGMAAYIGIRAGDNINEMADVRSEKMADYMEHYVKPVHFDQRVKHTKWVVLRYPNSSMAQLADTSLESFEDFYFSVCNLDYGKMSKAMDALVELMEKTDRVRIKGNGTDLSFSIKDIPAVKCDGKENIPDGEVFTAPVRESVNGTLTYNCPAVYQGVTYDNISFSFKDGKIVQASSNNPDRMNKVLDTDPGARFIGEFAIGVNPFIIKAMKDTLFDEKIRGSFHFTPGKCYDEASNGNNSAIHWDLVCIQTQEYGGGQIFFDNVLVRENGIFVIPELIPLNPENLE